MIRLSLFALALTLAGCSTSPPVAPVFEPLPVVRVVPGGSATVDVSGYPGAVFGAPESDSLRVAAGPGETAVVSALAAFEGLALVPFTAGGEAYVFAVEAPTEGAGRLALTVVGPRPGDPSVLDLDLRQVDASGRATELTVDEDTGVVVLVGDRIPSETAVDLAPDGRIGIDLDATGPGAHRVRVAARAGGLVSAWVAVTVRDGRVTR
ncbi:hypothetical protein [Rubrivirga sp. IMCC43871]|uniref:hypothetical protein n=1 Tax=Rubrivirga sp. IMCC43871 TaxID=3391575 RepID=UPI00398FD606